MTRVIIEPANNGYIMTTEHCDLDNDVIVVEDSGGRKHVVALLYSLLEALGELGNKHDEERVSIIRLDKTGNEIID